MCIIQLGRSAGRLLRYLHIVFIYDIISPNRFFIYISIMKKQRHVFHELSQESIPFIDCALFHVKKCYKNVKLFQLTKVIIIHSWASAAGGRGERAPPSLGFSHMVQI